MIVTIKQLRGLLACLRAFEQSAAFQELERAVVICGLGEEHFGDIRLSTAQLAVMTQRAIAGRIAGEKEKARHLAKGSTATRAHLVNRKS